MPRSDAGAGSAEIVFKAVAHPETRGPEYVMSDGSVDRMGDVIEPDGWDLRNFGADRNPIALFNHNSMLPIGRWENVRVERGQLRGHLRLAKRGTSERIDEIISLQEQGILRATSVGFRPIERERLERDSGYRFKRSELVECSLVSVPANANALQIAKDLRLSADVKRLVFGEPADMTPATRTVRGWTGEPAANLSSRKPTPMEPLATKIAAAHERLDALKAQLDDFTQTAGDEPDEAALDQRDDLNKRVSNARRHLDSLEETERQMADAATQRAHERRIVTQPVPARAGLNGEVLPPRRTFAEPAKKLAPEERALQVLVGVLHAKMSKQHTAEQVIAERYGEDGRIDPVTRGMLAIVTRAPGQDVMDIVQRAATAPATTFTSGWASQLVETTTLGYVGLLMPASIFPRLRAGAIGLQFGRAGVISVPSRSATPSIAGSFVAEGAPIPVRQAAFASTPFTPKKMGVITSFTREIMEHSNPTIEVIVREAIQEDTSVALDTVLIDATAATAVRPGGIRAGIAGGTPTAGGGFAAVIGDLKAMLGALNTATNGNIRRPTWLMNQAQALSLSLTTNAGGDMPFAADIGRNTLQGYPVIVSNTVPATMVILIDAADFVVLDGAAPRFDLSDQTVLVYDDTAPAQIATGAQGAGVVGSPARSMFQTDSVALRMVFDVNWGFIRTPAPVAWVTGVTW